VITRKQLLSFWPDVLGIVALVLPFTAGVRPLILLGAGAPCLFGGCGTSDIIIWLWALGLAHAIPIAVWQLTRTLRGRLTKSGQALAYALSTAAMLIPIFTLARSFLLGYLPNEDQLLTVFVVVSVCTFVSANALLLRRNCKKGAPSEVSAGTFLVGGYLPHATLLLIGFFSPGPFSRWDVGAYFVFAACVGYVLRIISLMRHGTKAYRPE